MYIWPPEDGPYQKNDFNIKNKEFDIIIPDNPDKNGILAAIPINPAGLPIGQEFYLNMGILTMGNIPIDDKYWVIARRGDRMSIGNYKTEHNAMEVVKHYLIDTHGAIPRNIAPPYEHYFNSKTNKRHDHET